MSKTVEQRKKDRFNSRKHIEDRFARYSRIEESIRSKRLGRMPWRRRWMMIRLEDAFTFRQAKSVPGRE